jgi:Single Cache domain 2
MAKMATKSTLVGLVLGGALCAAALAVPQHHASACGSAEGTGSRNEATGTADEARWMLKRTAAAVQANEPWALNQFMHGEGGFRTFDLYVFCVGPDGRVSAHPDPALMGRDARALRDPNGESFAAEMLDVAREGVIAQVRYLYPQPGLSVPVPKTSYVTRVKDQVCGVGYYEELASGFDHPPSPRPASPESVPQA